MLTFGAAFAVSWWFLHARPTAPDFTILYAAGTPGPVYDANWLTSLQHGLHGPRPFAYPPTLLLLLRPLALLPYALAFCLWCAVSVVLFVEAAARVAPRGAWLVLFSPVFILAALAGQTTLLVGALTVTALSLTGSVIPGLLLGLAFSIKPQVLILVPWLLFLRRQWTMLGVMVAAGLGVCLASLALGPHLWVDWLSSLRGFQAMNRDLHVPLVSVPPAYLPFTTIIVALLVLQNAQADLASRLIATLGGSLLICVHASIYDVAMLLPAILTIIFGLTWRSLVGLVVFATLHFTPWSLGIYVLAICLRVRGLPIRRGAASSGA